MTFDIGSAVLAQIRLPISGFHPHSTTYWLKPAKVLPFPLEILILRADPVLMKGTGP